MRVLHPAYTTTPCITSSTPSLSPYIFTQWAPNIVHELDDRWRPNADLQAFFSHSMWSVAYIAVRSSVGDLFAENLICFDELASPARTAYGTALYERHGTSHHFIRHGTKNRRRHRHRNLRRATRQRLSVDRHLIVVMECRQEDLLSSYSPLVSLFHIST